MRRACASIIDRRRNNERETWERDTGHIPWPILKENNRNIRSNGGCCLVFSSNIIKRPLSNRPPILPKRLSVEHPKGFYYLCESCDVACWIHYDFHFDSLVLWSGGLFFAWPGSSLKQQTGSRRVRAISAFQLPSYPVSCVFSLSRIHLKSSRLWASRCLSLTHSKVID